MTSNDQGDRGADMGAFGAALRWHRRNLDLSQEDLADATHGGVAARTISDLERGVARRPRTETLRLLATALRLTGEELAEFKAAARAPGRRTTATEAAAELAAPATGLAPAARRVASRPLIIVAAATRLAEVESLLSTAASCLVLVTGGGLLPGQDGAAARVVPLTAATAPGPWVLRHELPA
jgi:transcriptional regulator with XRE-family HTH domain